MKKFLLLRRNKGEIIFLVTVIILAAFFYFWKIIDWQYLSYDQSRDYLIIKRIILDKKLTLIGPSLGIVDGAYLPPFYYYLLLPSLWLSRFHIAGPDIFSAFLGILTVGVFYFVSKDFFNKFAASLATLFFVFNPYLIQAARHTRDPHMLPLFILLFLFAFKKYFLDGKRFFLILASFCLAAAISLHLTAIVFLPFLIFLFYQDFRKYKLNKFSIICLLVFSFFFLPLLLFDYRHGFMMSKSFANFFLKNEGTNLFFFKTGRFLVFLFKIPSIFLSGVFQKELLSLRSMPLASLEEVNLLALKGFNAFKIILFSIFWLFTLLITFFTLKDKRQKLFRMIGLFTLAGFLVSFLAPKNYSFFYYFYNLFPILFLLLAGVISQLINFWKLNLPKKRILTLSFLILAFLPILPSGLKTEIRPEKYFLPVAKVIANDSNGQKYVVASHLADSQRWERNALDYRFFLEGLYHLPVSNWEESDFREADVLYLIDEGNLSDPLSFGGMEMAAFKPQKIDQFWEVETGQKIYRMSK